MLRILTRTLKRGNLYIIVWGYIKMICKIHDGIKKILMFDEKISDLIWVFPVVLIVIFIILQFFFATGIIYIDTYLAVLFISSIIYFVVFIILLKLKNSEKIKKHIECVSCFMFFITIIYYLLLFPILIVIYALLRFYSKEQDDDPFDLIDSLIYISIVVLYFITTYIILQTIFQTSFNNNFIKYLIINIIVFILSFAVKYLYKNIRLKNAKSFYLENIHLFLMLSLFLSIFIYVNICQFDYCNEFNDACSALTIFIAAINKEYK